MPGAGDVKRSQFPARQEAAWRHREHQGTPNSSFTNELRTTSCSFCAPEANEGADEMCLRFVRGWVYMTAAMNGVVAPPVVDFGVPAARGSCRAGRTLERS